MPKIDFRVVGVTFRPVLFNSITQKSKVSLVPEPGNQHDSNAIKVIIDGNHVGYISKDYNKFLIDQINQKFIENVRVKKVSGGGGFYNGIIISVIFKTAEFEKISGNFVGFENSYKVLISLCNHNKVDRRYLFKKFLINSKLISDEPLLFRKKYEEKIESFGHLYKSLNFQKYLQSIMEYSILSEFNIDCKNLNRMEKSGTYITQYEKAIFMRLVEKYPTIQQAKIGNHPIDLVSYNLFTNRVWAIEIDGGIHGYNTIKIKDNKVNNTLLENGVSVIRVSNILIKKNIDNAFGQILQTIEYTI